MQSTPCSPSLLPFAPRRRPWSGAVALGLSPAAASAASTSSNWAGYVAHRNGVRYRTVTASWTVPTVTCSSRASYSAAWIGLGGYHTGSSALEQVGTEADCTNAGSARYSAWYELVPSAAVRIDMTVKPGDRLSARVTVNGKRVFVRLTNLTRGTMFAKTLTASAVDTTSADWIVEAPSECVGDTSSCRVLPLAQFSDATFTAARAVTTTGHSGPISDSAWKATAIDLAGDSRPFADPRDAASSSTAGAATGALSTDTFTVTFTGSSSEETDGPPAGGPGSI